MPRLARIVDAAPARVERFGIEQPREPLACVARREADDARGAGASRQERRLDQALKIDRDVVAGAPQLVDRADERRAAACVGSIVDDEPAIDHRHEIEDLAVLCADEPVDACRRKRAAQRRGDRDRMHDVAKRAEADDQETGQARAILLNRSREAWVFRSPTMAVRPPYAATVTRSGTDSTV